MSTVPTPVVLDSFFKLLENAGYDTYRPYPAQSGRMRSRAQRLVKSGIIKSRAAVGGGYMRTRSLSEIQFNEILPHWSEQDNPLAKLFYQWGECSIKEILSWPQPGTKGGDVTLHSAMPLLKLLNTETPLTVTMIEQKGYISGYTALFLTKGRAAGFLRHKFPKGYVLVKPFDEMTIGDILPVLSLRGKINAAVLYHSVDILLKDIED